MPGPVWRVTMTVPDAAIVPAEAMLADLLPAISVFEGAGPGEWLVEGFAERPPDRAELARRLALLAASCAVPEPALVVEALPPVDWLAHSFAGFPPLRLGRFFIHGSHDHSPSPPSTIALLIDAATAFGSGEHPSTEGCLRALEGLGRRIWPRRVLDLGCGTGILALAAAKLFHGPVVAADNDPEAVRVARHNARRNRAGRLIRPVRSDGFAAPAVRRGAPYDLILANILARPLARMAPALAGHLALGGRAVLSGLLDRDQTIVLAACRAAGLALERRVVVGRWPTLVVVRRNLDVPNELTAQTP